MNLPPPVPRTHKHTRRITCEGYRRDDGLWDIDARIVDTKTYRYIEPDRGSRAIGEPVHDMSVRLTSDDAMIVRDIVVVFSSNPYAACLGAAPNFKGLIGAKVGLGTDGMTQDLFLGVRTLPLAHRLVGNHPQSFGWGEVYQLAFLNNPQIAERFFGQPLGRLAVGLAADLMVLDYDPPTPLTGGNFLGHLLFGMGVAPVHSTMVAGRFVMREGRVLGVNEEEVFARTRELAQKLWKRW